MNKYTRILLITAMAVLVSTAGAFAAGKVIVGKVMGNDAAITAQATTLLPFKLANLGIELTTDRSQAKYEVQAMLQGEANRSFNFWVLLVWLWPIVPLTNQNAMITANVKLVDLTTGKEVFSNVGMGKAHSPMVLGDFTAPESLLQKASDQALTLATMGLESSMR